MPYARCPPPDARPPSERWRHISACGQRRPKDGRPTLGCRDAAVDKPSMVRRGNGVYDAESSMIRLHRAEGTQPGRNGPSWRTGQPAAEEPGYICASQLLYLSEAVLSVIQIASAHGVTALPGRYAEGNRYYLCLKRMSTPATGAPRCFPSTISCSPCAGPTTSECELLMPFLDEPNVSRA